MVNVIIYLKKEHQPKEVVKYLLKEKLIASASIDENNVYYEMEGEELSKEIYYVVTALSKSLLFKDIVTAVEKRIGEDTPIDAIPIVASNTAFGKMVRAKTKKI